MISIGLLVQATIIALVHRAVTAIRSNVRDLAASELVTYGLDASGHRHAQRVSRYSFSHYIADGPGFRLLEFVAASPDGI